MLDPLYDNTYLVTDPDGKLRRKRPPDDLICDFCCGPLGESCWTYPCGDIELPLIMDPTGLPARSDDPWACCQACRPLVEANDWRGLAERSLWLQIEKLNVFHKIEPYMEEAVVEIIAHFERFDAARNGEPFEEHAPYTEHQ